LYDRREDKKCGFVVDLNIHRVIETSVINYASLIKPDIHPKRSYKIHSTRETYQFKWRSLDAFFWE